MGSLLCCPHMKTDVERTLEENNSLMDLMDTHINTMQRK